VPLSPCTERAGKDAFLYGRVSIVVVAAAPLIPVFNRRRLDVVSKGGGNYEFHPVCFALFDQM